MNFAIINSTEKDLIRAIEEKHKDDSLLWKLPNLVFPLTTILLALICFLAFSDNRFKMINYLNLVINGSLPLIAINQISSTGIHIFKFDREKEKLYGQNTFMLRTKLFWYSMGILILGVILFAFQVITNPFSNWLLLIVMILISSLLIYCSSFVSKRLYLLQDNFIERTFDSDIRDEAKGKHGHNW